MKPSPVTQLRATVTTFAPHVRACKKSPGECDACRTIIAWFAALPLKTLSAVLEERKDR